MGPRAALAHSKPMGRQTMASSDEAWLRNIAARATPLWDRIPLHNTRVAEPDLELARPRIERWQQVLGSAGALALERRLRGSALSPVMLEGVLGGLQSDAGLPAWASALFSILGSYSTCHDVDRLREIGDAAFDPSWPLPFQEVLIGFLEYAREQLRVKAGSAMGILRFPAISALDRQLLAHLTFVASLALGQDFSNFRFERAPASAIESVWRKLPSSTEIYWAYVHHMYNGGLKDLLDRYPVLARLLTTSVEQWVRASSDFCQRFRRDFEDLQTFFDWQVDQPEGAVEGLRTDLSDRHSGGQTVSECMLWTGERVVYKPRTIGPEVAFYRFIRWLNGQGMSLGLRELRALDRTTHGWVESVACTPCGSLSGVEAFYRRVGMLLGALHVTGTTDIHRENLIACGEHPVVVDLETMLSDITRDLSLPGKAKEPASGVASVMSTGLLPRWQTAADGHQFDVSGLGADEEQDQGVYHVGWQSINTDQMTLAQEESFPAPTAHRVRLGERLPSAADHLSALLAGFAEVYSLMMRHRERLFSDEEFMGGFDRLELRVLVRNTTTYTRLQLHLLHPEFLEDGLDRSIELEWLARPLSGPQLSWSRQQIYDLERNSMESLDIPHFLSSMWNGTEPSSENDLIFLWGDRDSRVFRRRLAGLCPADCCRQLAAIQEAVISRFGVAWLVADGQDF